MLGTVGLRNENLKIIKYGTAKECKTAEKLHR